MDHPPHRKRARKLDIPGHAHFLTFSCYRRMPLRYCHDNPVKRRLVAEPSKWVWSSYRWLEEGRRAGEPLQIDDWEEALIDEGSP